MENPYKHAAGTAAASPDAARFTDYELAIGPNREYYLPRFEELDQGGSRVGWHWPAFFVTSPWFLYRKMWLPGVLNLLWPWTLLFVSGIAFAVLKDTVETHPVVFAILFLVLLAAPWFLLPIYANALYWRHIRSLIARLPVTVAQNPEKRALRLERDGGTGVAAMIGACLGMGFFLMFVVGILAAIAIPAYQDYSIRAQVTEGLNLAAPVKAQVAEFYATHSAWPEQADLGAERPSGQYVASVGVAAGSVVITYGNAANKLLANKRVVLTPGIDAQGDIRWSCGNASQEQSVTLGDRPFGSDIANKHLPASCREGGYRASRP